MTKSRLHRWINRSSSSRAYDGRSKQIHFPATTCTLEFFVVGFGDFRKDGDLGVLSLIVRLETLMRKL